MFIVKEGDLSRLNKEKTFECPECGCVFVAKKEEYITLTDYESNVFFKCRCPCCHLLVTKT